MIILRIMILRARGPKFFSYARGEGWLWFAINLIPGGLGIYVQFGE